MQNIDQFILNYAKNHETTVRFLHKFLISKCNLSLCLNFHIPFYFKYNPICYFNPLIDYGLELAFSKANELTDTNGLLQSLGRKQVFGLNIDKVNNLKVTLIEQLIKEAIFLDEQYYYKSITIEKSNTLIRSK